MGNVKLSCLSLLAMTSIPVGLRQTFILKKVDPSGKQFENHRIISFAFVFVPPLSQLTFLPIFLILAMYEIAKDRAFF